MHGAPSPNVARHAYRESTETYASPFITDREAEGACVVQAEAPHECKCSGSQPVREAVAAEVEMAAESAAGRARSPVARRGAPSPSQAYQSTIRHKGNPEGSVIDRTQGDPNVNLALQLFDYDVNEYRLAKNNHRNAIATVTEFVVKRLAQTNQPIAVTISGSTSRTGAAGYNDVLSCKRARVRRREPAARGRSLQGFDTRVSDQHRGRGIHQGDLQGLGL